MLLYLEENTASILGQDTVYTVKYSSLPEGVPKGKARGNSCRPRALFDRIFRAESYKSHYTINRPGVARAALEYLCYSFIH